MKKFLKIMAIIIAIAAAVAAVIIYLKNNGYIVFKEDEEEENDFPVFDDVTPKKRKYVSILPIKKFCKEEDKEVSSIEA